MENKTKFKVGDHVRVIESEDKIINTNFIGKESIIIDSSDCYYVIKGFYRGGKEIEFDESELELIPKTLENLECGDVIKNCFDTLEVLAILAPNRAEKTCYLLSNPYGEYTTGSISLASKLEKDGFTIYTPEPEKTDREKLVEEYAEKIFMLPSQSNVISTKRILTEFSDKLK